MQRRIIAAVAAVVLAGIGTILLYTYVNTAEQRAMANMESTNVLVVAKDVPVGTLGANLAPYVEMRQLPRLAVAGNALTDLTDVAGLVTASELSVGEQVSLSRFIPPDTTVTGDVEVPSDMQLVSVSVEAPRAVGSTIQAGDKVGAYFTGEDSNSKAATSLALRDVLVVRVQGGIKPEGEDAGAPAGTLIVTVALKPKDAIQLVYAAENNRVYFALEPRDGGDERMTVRVGDALQ